MLLVTKKPSHIGLQTKGDLSTFTYRQSFRTDAKRSEVSNAVFRFTLPSENELHPGVDALHSQSHDPMLMEAANHNESTHFPKAAEQERESV